MMAQSDAYADQSRQRPPEATFGDSSDLRAHRRQSVELDVHLGSEHNFFAGFVENLSVGGIFVATHQAWEIGSIFEFYIFLPGREAPITGSGEMRWIRVHNEDSDLPAGMGIRFLWLDEGCESAIVSFIRQREPLFFEE